jgi:hypothetical protein
MVDSLGPQFFGEKFNEALFRRDDKTYELVGVGNGKKVRVINVNTGDNEDVPYDFFTGFKVFAYPRLGWRRFGENYVAYCTKTQSAKRGLSTRRVERSPSLVTQRLRELGLVHREEFKIGEVLMNPKWTPLMISLLCCGVSGRL